MPYLTSPLSSNHIKKDFDCGIDLLTKYLKTQANQDIKRKLTACFVLAEAENIVKGYYTLSNASIRKELVPVNIVKKLPPTYFDLPNTLLGRLAVDVLYKGNGNGELLLIDALKRSFDISKKHVGSMAVIVDPIDENAFNFYKKYGFNPLVDSGKMFIAMDTIKLLF